ncbi:spermatogenesis-associated protein 31D4-like [Mus pahari]|uniref:spermatogenesis-associated protein 31D4-like n=1 Tax=Mus pahari TaxID=10093 RepID=UPI000A30AB91|nr:spermatogenesis-associated protein 31D4-like [Mus pahari]
MENILSFLNRSWLGFGSAFLDIGSNYIFLSGVGSILLYLWYLLLKPFFPPPWKSQDIKKCQGTANKGRRRSLKGCRTTRRKTQEQRKLLSIVQSPLGENYDSSNFRQLLCPDPFCGVCNGATAKISHLLSQATHQDCAASMSSMDSTVSVTETSLTLSLPLPENTVEYPISDTTYEPSLQSSSIISSRQSEYLEDTLSVSPLGDSLLSESIPPVNAKSPLDHNSLHQLASLPLPQQHATQETELLLQPTTVLSLVGSPMELFTNVPTNNGICSSSYAMSEFIQQQTDTGNSSQLESAHPVNQELLDPYSSESYLWGNTTTYLTLPGNLNFSSLGAVALLETQDGRRADSLKTWEKTSEFDHQNLAVSHSLGGSKERLHMPQHLSYSKTSEDQLEDKHTQFFWGLPSLHSESMNSIATALTDSSLISGCFNRFSDSPMLTHRTPLPLSESQLHNLSQSLSHSQSQPVPQANPQAQLQPPIPVLSPHSQLRFCGVYFHNPQNEAQPLEPSAIHCLEYNILKKEQERVWGLPTVVKNSQQKFCPPPPNPSLVSQFSKTHVPKSISIENCLITSELRKKFEHHLRKRLILQRWGLPKRIRESLLWMNPQAELPESPSSKSNYGLSWIPFFKQQSKKDLHNTILSQPRSFPAKQLEEKLLKLCSKQSLETVQKQQTWTNTKGTLDNGLQSDCETNLQCHSDSLLCKPSGTSKVNQCQKKLETSLKEHLTTCLNETIERQITSTMSRSRYCPSPFTSCVNKEEHKAQKPSDNKDGHVKNISTVKKSVKKQTSFDLDNTSLEESKGNRHNSDVPKMLSEVLGKRLSPAPSSNKDN